MEVRMIQITHILVLSQDDFLQRQVRDAIGDDRPAKASAWWRIGKRRLG
jgi:hypothetical protein